MTTETRQQIAINFFQLVEQDFEMSFYRKRAEDNSEAPFEFCRRYKIPESTAQAEDAQYLDYWVSADQHDGFESFTCSSRANPFLTVFLLLEDFIAKCEELEIEHAVQRKFDQRIVFPIENHKEGDSCIWILQANG